MCTCGTCDECTGKKADAEVDTSSDATEVSDESTLSTDDEQKEESVV